MRSNFFTRLFDMVLRGTYKVKFNPYWRFHDRDCDRSLQQFHVHGEPVMAYSRKDAIKRWVHADLKNRRRRSRR